jgi:alpha-1,2-mannosyltransferase
MRIGDFERLLSADRVRGYSRLLVAAYVLAGVGWLISMTQWVDPLGKPVGYDFITFYAASDLARQGHAAAAFDIRSIYAAEQAAVPANTSVFLWHYPPPFQLIIAPLAYVPYGVALAGWLAGTLALYLLLVRRLSDHPLAPMLALAFPAVFINAMHGQNGFLNTALLGFGLVLLDRRPWLAGLLLGLLVYKPHFGVLLPLLLLVQGRWKSIGSAALSASALCAASYAAYGPEPWLDFVRNFDLVARILENRFLPWGKIPSVFVAVADLGAPFPIAYAVHAAVAATLALLTAWAWRRPGDQALKVALAVPAILAVSPYCFDYDLVMLAIPIALVADYGRRHRLPDGTKAVLALAFVTPIAFAWIGAHTPIHLMPVAILALYAAIWRVIRRGEEPLGMAVAEDERSVPVGGLQQPA